MGSDNSQAEGLVETLNVEGSSLSEALSTNDFEQLAQFSHELHFTSEMDATGSESDVLEAHELQTEVVQPEIGAQEVEIETERPQSPEEILPEIKVKSSMPPLRPLTIAPKPPKAPITLKSAGGQQLLVLQGSTGGQPIKLVSSQGQGISVANISLGKPITFRQTGKSISGNTMSVLQPKQVIMKKVMQPQKIIGDTKSIVLADKVEMPVKSSQGNIMLPNPAKTITLAQAQQIGLLTNPKLLPQMTTKQAIVVNKPQNKTIKIVPQTKPQAKILPAPQASTANKVAQRIILKQPNASPSIVTAGQLIQVSGNQQILGAQLHQINIPGKGIQYIKIVTPSTNPDANVSSSAVTNVVTRQAVQTPTLETKVLSTVSTALSTKPSTVVFTEAMAGTNIAPKPVKAATLARPNTVHLPTSGQLVMLSTNYLPQPTTTTAKVAIPAKAATSKTSTSESNNTLTDVNMESNGMRPRKPCNCTKSQCLKLYCDCFANGEFCYLCNCMNCYNNLENEEHRQRAIKSCLERNPNAFRPKIGKAKDTGDSAVRKHTKGCNCKRSGCLKNYCECYEAKIACSSNCKCLGCRNIEDSIDKKGISPQTNLNLPTPISPPLSSKLGNSRNFLQFRPRRHSNNKHAFSFITDDVIEATSQCLLAISDSAEADAQDDDLTKLQIIEEFGRCLKEIIDCSMNHNVCNSVN